MAVYVRDVKPENLLGAPASGDRLHVRLIDFGSALDAFSIHHLYGARGPSAEEQSADYAPPEALLGRCVPVISCTPNMTAPNTVCTQGVRIYNVSSKEKMQTYMEVR